jgi:hypothetical protein
MKKSKIVSIGLLAMSIASCHKRTIHHPLRSDWNDQNVYVSTDGTGYVHTNNNFPIWLYMYMVMNSQGRTYYYPASQYYVRSSSFGRSRSIGSIRGESFTTRSSFSSARSGGISRGGFGSSGHASVGE